MPSALAAEMSEALPMPVIGIGAGARCAGQVLVLHDMLGLNVDFRPRFLRRFGELGEAARAAIADYVEAVKGGGYPSESESYEA
jgi:3-methyl-2-oxobutanoate hydroxymethyltransferase